MTNAEKIRTLNNDDLAYLIREIYFNGSDGNGFAFCRYNLESWLKSEYQENIQSKYEIFRKNKNINKWKFLLIFWGT